MTIPVADWEVGDVLQWIGPEDVSMGCRIKGEINKITSIVGEYIYLSDGTRWNSVYWNPLTQFWTLVPPTPTFKTGDRVKRTSYDLGNDIYAGLPGIVEAVGSVDMLVRGDGWVRSYPINGGYWEHNTTPAPVSDKPIQCKKCGDGFPMAVANQPDGVSMICWSCRNRR